MTMTTITIVKDLVCDMDIDTATAAEQSVYRGQTYYFCGSTCKKTFDLDPTQYVGKPGEAPKSDKGCCS